ncbi:MAG TPA: HdeD family acid-resistance protein [Chroococcales cyanobacterium]
MTTTMRPPQLKRAAELHSGPVLFLGISLTLLGIAAIVCAFLSTISTVLMLGVALLLAGFLECVHTFRLMRQRKEGAFLHVLSTLAYFYAGFMMLWNPMVGAVSLTLLISAFLLVNGIINLSHGIRDRSEPQSSWFIFGGIVDLVLGALIAIGWPATALWVIGVFVGVEMIMYGIGWMALSITMKRLERQLNERIGLIA